MCLCALALLATPADAKLISSVEFTGSGTITDYSINQLCDPEECGWFTPENLGLPPLGTAWTLSGSLHFPEPVPDTGEYYYYEDPAPPFEFSGTISLTIPGYAQFGWDYGWASDWVRMELKRGVPNFETFIEGCAGMFGIFSSERQISYTYTGCDGFNFGDVVYSVHGSGKIDRILVDGAELAVPEPATWSMLIAGFGLVGAAIRRRRTGTANA